MIPPRPRANQYRVQRWVVRRGPLIASAAVTGVVVAKTASLILDIFGLSVLSLDSFGLLEQLDQVPWPIAILMFFAAWLTVFLGVPLWQKYLAYENRRRPEGEEEPWGEPPVIRPSKGARQRR